jgi:translation initiation factor IF-1
MCNVLSKNKDVIKMTGIVIKCLPGGKFIVKADDIELDTMCTISGKLRQNKIKIYENDKVDFEVSVYDFTQGRIVWRY